MQGVWREALVTRRLVRRKLERMFQRNATEMAAARFTGTLPPPS